MGGKPYVAPTVEIKPIRDRGAIIDFHDKIVGGQLDSVVFMSVNGVREMIEALEAVGLRDDTIEGLSMVDVVAIGPKTRQELERHGIRTKIMPSRYCTEGVIESLREIGVGKKRVAVLRAEGVDSCMRRELERMGASVLEVPIYRSVTPSDESKVITLIDDLLQGKIDAITFTSSSTVQNLFDVAHRHNLASRLKVCLEGKIVVATIGPVTQRALEELGVKVDVVPKEFTVNAMMKALSDYIKGCGVK